MILGDLGADVLKVERPVVGDDTRGWGPPFDADGQSAYFLSVNRNKISVAVDLGHEAGVAWLRTMLIDADVVIDNFRHGQLAAWGLDVSAELAAHPRLLWCTISGFGQQSDRPGYDFVVQAESGWMSINGEPQGAPLRTGVALADVMAGKDAAIAVLTALLARERGIASAARHIHVSLLHSATAALVNVAQNTLVSGQDASRWGNAHPNLVPYQLFDALDRPLVIAVGTDTQFRACAKALGLAALQEDERYRTNAGRIAHRHAIVGAIRERVLTQPAAVWIERLEHEGVPCGVVKPVSEALRAVETSPVTGIAPQGPGTVRRAPPRLDAHGDLVRAHGWAAFDRTPL